MESPVNATIQWKNPIAPQVLASLRQAIGELTLPPGTILSEQEIAGRFGVSRQPVREAFIKLAEAGLVEIRPSRGTYVTKISIREVANARFVREAIECEMASNAARLASESQIDLLRRIVVEQKQAAERSDFAEFSLHDETFHRAIADVVQNEYAWRVVESARFQTDRVRLLSLPDSSPLPVLIAQHEAITDAIAARDTVKASETMRRHLREILVALPRVAAAHPDFFTDPDLPEHTRAIVPSDSGLPGREPKGKSTRRGALQS